jgi:hypothetical protein
MCCLCGLLWGVLPDGAAASPPLARDNSNKRLAPAGMGPSAAANLEFQR